MADQIDPTSQAPKSSHYHVVDDSGPPRETAQLEPPAALTDLFKAAGKTVIRLDSAYIVSNNNAKAVEGIPVTVVGSKDLYDKDSKETDSKRTESKETGSKKKDASEDAKKDDIPPPPETGAFISYKLNYTNFDDVTVVYSKTAYEPINKGEHEGSDKKEAAFDVIKTYKTVIFYGDDEIKKLKGAPPVKEGFTLSILIRSSEILKALRSFKAYYPEVDLSVNALKLNEPYRFLIHHFDRLTNYRDSLPELPEGEDTTRDGRTHLTLLLNFLEDAMMAKVREEQERHKRNAVTFDMLWLLLRPEAEVAIINYSPEQKGGNVAHDAALLATVGGGPQSPSERSAWQFNVWNLIYDGVHIRRAAHAVTVSPFDGEMDISRLDIMPLGLAPSHNGTSLRNYLIEQGRRWFDYIRHPGSRNHSGEVLNFPFHRAEGHVMVDYNAWVEFDIGKHGKNAHTRVRYEERKRLHPDDDDPYCPFCRRHRPREPPSVPNTERYSNFDDFRPETKTALDELQYLLAPQRVPAYFFKTRQWHSVDVLNLSDAKYSSEIFDKLVMDRKRKDFLLALSKGFVRDDTSPRPQSWTADFVKGKGNSQIFLLHGPPGVGKTFTAECIAEHTKRPLMTLTTSDIGTNPAEAEKNLERNFNTAKKWGAILLIDEADIYLERRADNDLDRNSLVAGFLRALEIYEGILFLTTNRIGTFDEAFISRIHVKLHYKPLQDDDRQNIWANFIRKLEAEREEYMRMTDKAEEYLNSKKIKQLKLNGREIRNIFQTAVGLAEYEDDKDKNGKILLKKDHLQQVADMSGEFKEYIDELLVGDGGTVAKKQYLRLDTHGSKKKSKNVAKEESESEGEGKAASDSDD